MPTSVVRTAVGMTLVTAASLTGRSVQSPPRILKSEFVAVDLSTPSAHASTIAETADGLVAAWFGGTREGAPDVGIWLSRLEAAAAEWTAPVEVATGLQPDGPRFPCWNPVLVPMPDGSLSVFYKVGPAPARWWGMVRRSTDGGRSWSDAERLPDGVLGPVKNKALVRADGVVVSPSSTESTETPPTWRVHFERSTDGGRSWTIVAPPKGAQAIEAIQPSLLTHPDGRLEAIGRTRSGRLFETWSDDDGRTWTPLELLDVPNPNAGIDAVTLGDGRHWLVYNPTTEGRTPLAVATSRDGRTWTPVLVLEDQPGEYSYPAIIQTRDGLVHVTYTWRRRNIRHVLIDPGRQ